MRLLAIGVINRNIHKVLARQDSSGSSNLGGVSQTLYFCHKSVLLRFHPDCLIRWVKALIIDDGLLFCTCQPPHSALTGMDYIDHSTS